MPGGALEWCQGTMEFLGMSKSPVMGGEWHMRKKMTARGVAYEIPTLYNEDEQSVGFRLFGELEGTITDVTDRIDTNRMNLPINNPRQ